MEQSILKLVNRNGKTVFDAKYVSVLDHTKGIDYDYENGSGRCNLPEEMFMSALCTWSDAISCVAIGTHTEEFKTFCRTHWVCDSMVIVIHNNNNFILTYAPM